MNAEHACCWHLHGIMTAPPAFTLLPSACDLGRNKAFC